MTPLKFVLSVAYLLIGNVVGSTPMDLSSPLHFLSVNINEDVTLKCFYEESVAVMFYWYKQTLGQKPELVSKFYKHNKNGSLIGEFNNNPRFELDTDVGKNHLKISNVQNSDAATYYCLSGYSYRFKFIGGVIVHVKSLGLKVPTIIHQPGSETIQPGGSVTLNCTVQTETCEGEHSVYWFRNSEESHRGLIYTHGGRNNQCERRYNQQTCVYSLNLSDTGTYYCAVVSCGHILFGNGTKLDFKDHDLALVYFLSAVLAFVTMLVVFLAYKASTLYKTSCCKCTADHQAGTPAASNVNVADEQEADSLHYAALRKGKVTRSTRPREDVRSECVYSSVRQ